MQNHRFVIFIILFLFVSNPGYMASEEKPWKLEKNEKGITVFSRSSAATNFKEIKVETNIKAPLTSLVALLRDVQGFKDWVYRCETSHVVKHIVNQEVIYYQRSDVPWPASDRDLVVHSKFRQDEVTKAVYFNSTAAPEHMPEQDGVVRIKKFKGSWKLTPKLNGSVDIEYQVGLDPGGLIPAWIVNMASTDGPFITTLNLKEIIKSPKYQQAKLSFIKELK